MVMRVAGSVVCDRQERTGDVGAIVGTLECTGVRLREGLRAWANGRAGGATAACHEHAVVDTRGGVDHLAEVKPSRHLWIDDVHLEAIAPAGGDAVGRAGAGAGVAELNVDDVVTFDRLQPEPVQVTVTEAVSDSSSQMPDPACAHQATISQVSLSSGSTGSDGLAWVPWLTVRTEETVSSLPAQPWCALWLDPGRHRLHGAWPTGQESDGEDKQAGHERQAALGSGGPSVDWGMHGRRSFHRRLGRPNRHAAGPAAGCSSSPPSGCEPLLRARFAVQARPG